MKKVTTMAIIGGKERQISVYIEEELADWLDTIDEATRRDFIVQEWKVALSERAETRRHQSLETLMEEGWDATDESKDIVSDIVGQDSVNEVRGALKSLSEDEREIVVCFYFKKQSLTDISKHFHVYPSTIMRRIEKILKKLKLFLKNTQK